MSLWIPGAVSWQLGQIPGVGVPFRIRMANVWALAGQRKTSIQGNQSVVRLVGLMRRINLVSQFLDWVLNLCTPKQEFYSED